MKATFEFDLNDLKELKEHCIYSQCMSMYLCLKEIKSYMSDVDSSQDINEFKFNTLSIMSKNNVNLDYDE